MNCYRYCEAMGTRFEIFLRGQHLADSQHLEAVAVVVIEEFVRLDNLLSRFDPRSEIARVNRQAGGKAVRIDRELFALLSRCEQAREMTDGHFDVAHGASLVLDENRCTVQFTNADAAIDLGAVGKGYALDCGREILLRYGVTSGLLQGGTSSVLAVGEDAWPIDVRHPQSPDVVAGRIDLVNRGFSCSAVRHVGQQQSDVLNPLTGELLTGNDVCVVLAANATDAEVFSTALLAMGREHATRYLERKPAWNVNVGWIETNTEPFLKWVNAREICLGNLNDHHAPNISGNNRCCFDGKCGFARRRFSGARGRYRHRWTRL